MLPAIVCVYLALAPLLCALFNVARSGPTRPCLGICASDWASSQFLIFLALAVNVVPACLDGLNRGSRAAQRSALNHIRYR